MTLTATKPHPIYVAGKWVDSPDMLVVDNPANPKTPAGATYNATEEQYEEAVTAAVAAFEHTRALPAYERGRALREISNGIKARREEIGRILSTEAGKPIRDALVEVDRATLTFRLGAEEAERMYGETIPLDLMASSKGRVGITRRFPIGPVAAIPHQQLNIRVAAEVKNFDPAQHFEEKKLLLLDRFSQFTLLAAREAVKSSGIAFKDELARDSARGGTIGNR